MDTTELSDFIEAVQKTLPLAFAHAVEKLAAAEYGTAAESPALWLEAMAQVTNHFIQKTDQKTVTSHLEFFSEQLERATGELKHLLEVYYVENLLWEVGEVQKAWALDLFSPYLAEVYSRATITRAP
ncbi:hypothetical protein KKF84_13345 [Myxococcota bacterium]|nr:hypothetical protein [Myxococcota bacterium]